MYKYILTFIISFLFLIVTYAQKDGKGTSKKFEPTLLSLNTHQVPEWFEDAKFGMFIDYGLYSVGGWASSKGNGAVYPDWFLSTMYSDPDTKKYTEEHFGKGFERDDFIPLFKAEKFDPKELAKIAAEAGMKYVVPFCKHHDGFCLWPSSYTKRDVGDVGPQRDLIGPLVKACNNEGLKFGFYFSLEEWEYPILVNGEKQLRIWNANNPQRPFDTIPYDAKIWDKRVSGKIPVKDYYRDYMRPQAKEFIDKYDPDLIWFDGEWVTPTSMSHAPEIVSYYYNHAAGRKAVAVNDRVGNGSRYNSGDFCCSEHGGATFSGIQAKLVKKWEECRGISHSFGFNIDDNESSVISSSALIDMLVTIVSENGNLLLVVNLDGKGNLPDYIKSRLVDIGKWLKVNGEAIYGTRPWILSNQGDNLRFTQSKNKKFLYVIHKGWPGKEISIKGVYFDPSAKITMLGSDQMLKWHNDKGKTVSYGYDGNLVVEIPESLKKLDNSDCAYTLKIQIAQ